ncbi:vWA domain-containing protein [Nocardia altamirensis]|uniref:vWA domain-containing protein n=1 Tax=Nocardia altamirensis TaxID=472158 RepID=UPI0008404A84|nr:VWA domain-containing protein [Nocardia altamirensis]
MSRFTTFTAVFAACLLGLTMVAQQASAQPNRSEQTAKYAPTMLILDASGSMQRPDPAGTMMDAAKNAVRTFVGAAPAESKVGLTVYGTSTGNTEADKPVGCRDVQVLRQPDALDRAAFTSAVDGIKASGWTPMGTALRQAAQTLPNSGPRSIVLVSDGDDTCAPPDPCAVAQELKKQGIDLVLHAIGFAVDDKARAQLTCMAQATGTPITGAASYDKAPAATPGQYLDTIGQKEKRYYAVDVPAGATAYFSGIVSFPRVPGISTIDDFNSLRLQVFGREGQDCNASETEQASRSSDGVALTISKTFDGATKQPTGSASSDRCKGAGRYYFSISWERVSLGVPARLPIELLVGIEPAATDPGPVAVLPPTAFVEPVGPGKPAPGGGSFTVATTLDGSGRYSDTMQPGEYLFYRVKLDWGQGLAYRVHFDENGVKGLNVVSNITTTLYSPFGDEIDWDSHVYTGTAGVLPSNDPAMVTVPIRYHNRDADQADVRKQSVAGWYFIAVKLGSTFEEGHTPVPVRLDLTVAGTPEPGPVYSSALNGGVLGENAGPRLDKPLDRAVAQDVSSSKSSQNWIPIAAIGAGVVAILGVVLGWLFIRRRRS